jgi:hypothetical protein
MNIARLSPAKPLRSCFVTLLFLNAFTTVFAGMPSSHSDETYWLKNL